MSKISSDIDIIQSLVTPSSLSNEEFPMGSHIVIVRISSHCYVKGASRQAVVTPG